MLAGELVEEPGQGLVDMLGLGACILAAVVIVVGGCDLMIENGVIVALIEDQDAIVTQRGIELR